MSCTAVLRYMYMYPIGIPRPHSWAPRYLLVQLARAMFSLKFSKFDVAVGVLQWRVARIFERIVVSTFSKVLVVDRGPVDH